MKLQNLAKSILISLIVIAPPAFADGKIVGINFSGPSDPHHGNVVQIQIEGGFQTSGCNTVFAAIETSDENKHLISFALTAYATQEPISVVLNGNSKYFSDRCTISRISSVY